MPIDGELIAENLNPGSTEQISHQLAAGEHTLTVEYVEYVGNAFAQFDFQIIKDK